MTKYVNDIRELIGNTPLLKINNFSLPHNIQLFAKLEYWNPGGSVKDRIGIAMLKDAENRGILKPGATIIEATAGNTGLGIAMAALNTQYKVVFTVPEKFSQEKLTLMRALGAQVIITPRKDGLLGAQEKAKQLLAEIPNSIEFKQFENLSNPDVHYQVTGPEITQALKQRVDYFVAGAGSGGTFSGVAKYLKEQNPNLISVLADPIGSTMGGGIAASYNIEGIGNDFMPQTMDMSFVDHVIKVSDEEAFSSVKLLAAKEGLFVGSSSGAAMFAALKFISTLKDGGNVVVVFPDRGDRYFSKNLYD
jgi:cysteine synthase